jgi:hypothetical protein
MFERAPKLKVFCFFSSEKKTLLSGIMQRLPQADAS